MKNSIKNRDNKQFLEVLYKKSYFENKDNIISINLNQSNIYCLYSLKTKYLVCIKLLEIT